jgi:DNA replication ATP-dependent helicase Dna2
LGSEKTLSGNELLRDMVGLCREKGWVLDLQSDMVDSHAFDEGVSQTGRTLAKASPAQDSRVPGVPRSPSASPSKKRKALGEITGSSQGNTRSPKKRVTGKRVPEKVFLAGKRGVLDGRPVLRNIYEEAL